MSKINLTTVLWYQAGHDGRPIGPTVTLEGVESRFPSIKFPNKGITFFYGHRNPGEAYLLKEASQSGFSASIAQIPVDIGLWLRDKVGFAPDDPQRGIEHTGFFSVARAKKEILDVLEVVWRHKQPKFIEDFPKGATRFADVFDDLVEMEKFQHLKVIAYTVRSEEAGEFQVATVFDLSAIEGVTCGHLFNDVQIVSKKKN